MKFILATQELRYLVGKVGGVINPKPALPILSNFCLEAKGNTLTFTATDLTVGIQCCTEAKVLEEGKTTISNKNLANLLREIDAMQVEVTTGDDHITHIRAGESRFKLNGMTPDTFPSLPEMGESLPVTLKKGDLKAALLRTAFAVSQEDSRYVLNGVLLRIEGGQATFVGTDGKRLSRVQLALPLDPTFNKEYVLPIKAVLEMVKNLNEDDDEASLLLGDDKVALQSGETRLVTKLLAGDYPAVEAVIPQNAEKEITLSRDELVTLLRQIVLFTSDANMAVRFHFDEGQLHLDSVTSEVGEGNVVMPCSYQGPPFQAAFNPRYMRDILDHSTAEKMTFRLIDAFNPAIVVDAPAEEGEANPPLLNSLFVLMPMRTE